jgi:hemoglobin/transferrin/lactoferrin receptor protein
VQAEWYYGPQKRLLAAYTLELEKGRFYDEARITPSFQHVEQSRHTRAFGNPRLGSRWEQVEVYAINADLEKRKGRHEVRYGLEAYHNTVRSRAERRDLNTGEVTYLTTRYPNGGSTYTGMAAYATHTVELNERWLLSDGLRYNHIGLDARFADDLGYTFLNGDVRQRNGAFNWRAGLVYRPTKPWRITALGSTGFRAPNVDDLGKVFDSAPGRVIVPNPELRPERTVNAELGLSRSFGEHTTWELNAFHTWYTDAFVVGTFTSDGRDSIDYDGTLSQVTALTNAGRASITGGSSSITSNVSERLHVAGSFTYTYGRVRGSGTEQPLDHIPPVFGRGSIGYRMKRVQAEAYVLFNGWKRIADYSTSGEDNPQYATPDGMPAWYTLNVRGTYTVHRHLALQLGLENLLDRNYRTFASGISAPGRNLQVSIRTTF